ncbi:MAG: FhaA domain-containing protein [Candidatus Limnocylindria bacterium]
MGMLSRVETFLERLFEAPAGRLGATLQPVSIARRLERAMDSNKSFQDDGVVVPNQYEVHLSPPDYQRFAPRRGSLEDDLAHGLLARTRHERYILVARPRVQIVSDPAVRRGDARIAANVVDEEGGRLRADVPMPGMSDTMIFAPVRGDEQPPDSAVRAYLLVRTDGGSPVQFDLGGPLITIGRASDNDVIVDDVQVSRHHCQLKLQHGAYSFADLGSRNGSLVNGQPVSEIALGPGDVIRIGGTVIDFQVRG